MERSLSGFVWADDSTAPTRTFVLEVKEDAEFAALYAKVRSQKGVKVRVVIE